MKKPLISLAIVLITFSVFLLTGCSSGGSGGETAANTETGGLVASSPDNDSGDNTGNDSGDGTDTETGDDGVSDQGDNTGGDTGTGTGTDQVDSTDPEPGDDGTADQGDGTGEGQSGDTGGDQGADTGGDQVDSTDPEPGDDTGEDQSGDTGGEQGGDTGSGQGDDSGADSGNDSGNDTGDTPAQHIVSLEISNTTIPLRGYSFFLEFPEGLDLVDVDLSETAPCWEDTSYHDSGDLFFDGFSFLSNEDLLDQQSANPTIVSLTFSGNQDTLDDIEISGPELVSVDGVDISQSVSIDIVQ